VILLWCDSRASALNPALQISQYAHTAWTIREGFLTGVVSSIAQTADGYLWVGTETGLFRFDGVRLMPWQARGDERLPSMNITDLLVRLKDDYGGPRIIVTENGAVYADEPGQDGHVHDELRVAYIAEHLAAVHAAIEQGVDVTGYCYWSLLDNFEWALGYLQRFGIVHVDYETQRRVPKRSGLWYRDYIAAERNGGGVA